MNKLKNNRTIRDEKVESKINVQVPQNIKSLNEERVQEYLKWAVKFKTPEVIYAELNQARSTRTKELTINSICKAFVEQQNINNSNEITKKQVKDMFQEYLHSNKILKSRIYTWLTSNFYNIVDMLFRVKEKTAWNLSAEIFKRYNKVVEARYIKKIFARVGLSLAWGDRKKAIYRCGTYYRNTLERIEQKS